MSKCPKSFKGEHFFWTRYRDHIGNIQNYTFKFHPVEECKYCGMPRQFQTRTEQITEKMNRMGVKLTKIHCKVCERRLTEKQAKYSYVHYGKFLCFSCQRGIVPTR